MSKYIEADAVEKAICKRVYAVEVEDILAEMANAPSIDLADYVPKDFHDKTCEAMAKRHADEIASMRDIVRCKECKEWDKNDHECYLDRGGLYFPNADDFCSYGEREGE